MKFQSKTQEQIDKEKLLEPGEYPFVISGAEDKISKNGNEMVELTVRVFRPDGSFILVNDYLMEKLLYKLLHCCEAVGLENEYNSGTIAANDFIGKEGYVKIKTQEAAGGFPAKSVISDYVTSKDKEKTKIPKSSLDKLIDNDPSDEIPF